MNFNKLFLRLIAVFGLAMALAISGWGDIEPNDTNATAELNATFANLTNDVSGTLFGNMYKNGDAVDYYKINTTSGKAGTVDVNLTSTGGDIDLTIIRCNDGDTGCTILYSVAENKRVNHMVSIDMDINQTVYFRLGRQDNENTPYSLKLDYSGLKISIGNAILREWNSGMTGISFPITLTANSTVPIEITYRFDDIETDSIDTNMTSGSSYLFTLDENLSKGTHQILLAGIVGDTIQENNETFSITLESVSNGILDLTKNTGIGTIWDDDGANTPPPPPVKGLFSVVEAGLYDVAVGANKYYDLTTQVAKRHGDYKIISFEAGSPNTPKAVNADVAVDIIDLDTGTCDTATALTPRMWMHFEQGDGNESQIPFNEITTQDAINDGEISDYIDQLPITIATPQDYFKTAVKNATYRISYLMTNDGNDSLIQSELQPSGKRTILNFTDLVQNIGTCKSPVRHPSHLDPADTTTTDRVAVACGNAGNMGIEPPHFAICMECLFGYNNNKVCSRDNFSIRPESYTVVLEDVNQSNATLTQPFAQGYTGVTSPSTGRIGVAAGYQYRFDINATNHVDNKATAGYERDFGTGGSDYNITLIWEPSPGVITTGCNDTNDTSLNFHMLDGAISQLDKLQQVGEYRLHIVDKTWSAVDWNSTLYLRVNEPSHYLNSLLTNTPTNCTANSTVVPLEGVSVMTSGSNFVGCEISSTHNQVEFPSSANPYKYRDYNLTFHPYKFDMSTINFGVGLIPQSIVSGTNDFVYKSDMSRDDGMNMSLRATGNIRAIGYDNSNVSNFVDNCYAKNINLIMNSDANLTIPGMPFQYRFQDINSTNSIIFDSNATNMTNPQFITLLDGNFTKDMNGSLSTTTRFNFDRNQTTPTDPKKVQYTGFETVCQTTSECTMQADFNFEHQAIGNRAMDFNVTHVYGRIIPRDVRSFGDVAFTANAWYEVFNAPIISGSSLPVSRNTPMWYTNSLHDDNNDGDGNVTRLQSGPTASTAAPTSVNTAEVNGVETYSFGAPGVIPYSRKAHIDTAPWLWYGINVLEYVDPSAANLDCLTHPCFNINVVPAIGATGSAKSTNTDTKDSKRSTDGGGLWKSTTDYAPAIR